MVAKRSSLKGMLSTATPSESWNGLFSVRWVNAPFPMAPTDRKVGHT